MLSPDFVNKMRNRMTTDPDSIHYFDIVLDRFWKGHGPERQRIVVVFKDRVGHNVVASAVAAQFEAEWIISFCRLCAMSSIAPMAVESDHVAGRCISKDESKAILDGHGVEIGAAFSPVVKVSLERNSRWNAAPGGVISLIRNNRRVNFARVISARIRDAKNRYDMYGVDALALSLPSGDRPRASC
jgi:hypothetical protein